MTVPVRVERSIAGAASTVAVTGAAGPLGSALLGRLRGEPGVRRLVAIDTHRRPGSGVSWRLADVRDPALSSRLAGVDTVVHLASDRSLLSADEERRAVNVRGTEVLLDAAATAGVTRVVLVTSATVYGATATNPVPLDEDGPLLATDGPGLVGDWLAMERAAVSCSQRLAVTVLRPASLVGAVTDVLLPGLFTSVRLLAIRDGCCHWQFCHTDDLVDALALAATGQVHGAVTVGCDGWLERSQVEAVCGLRSVVLPKSVASASAERLHRIGSLRSPAADLDYLCHPWVVGSQRLRQTGWAPRWTNEQALAAHVAALGDRAGRGLLVVDRKDATRAAAGATLALIGSLAIARARRGRS